MSTTFPGRGGPGAFSVDIDHDAPVFVISVAAELAGMHPQTLRQYDRLGLVSASRTAGGGRRYSMRHVELLRTVQHLSQDEGINLAGIKRILDLQRRVDELESHLDSVLARLDAARAEAAEREAAVHASYRRDLVPMRTHQADVVLWRFPSSRPRV